MNNKNRVKRTVAVHAFGSPTFGREVWLSNCDVCHDLDFNSVGPPHRGVYGRVAGTADGFEYSQALKPPGKAWDYELLFAFTRDPQGVAPGTRMPSFASMPADQRHALIAYLRSLSPNPP